MDMLTKYDVMENLTIICIIEELKDKIWTDSNKREKLHAHVLKYSKVEDQWMKILIKFHLPKIWASRICI